MPYYKVRFLRKSEKGFCNDGPWDWHVGLLTTENVVNDKKCEIRPIIIIIIITDSWLNPQA